MITGTTQADAAILIVSASIGEFESGISKNGSTREHLMLAYTLGVRQLIIAINKMDSENVAFSEKRYNEIKTEVTAILTKIGWKTDNVPFVPIAGLSGFNLTEACDKMPWYSGPTLLAAIDGLQTPPRPTDKPLRMPIQDVYTIPGVGVVSSGRVESGTLKPAMTVKVAPSNIVGDVRSVEMHHLSVPEAKPGDNVGCNVRGFTAKDMKRGSVMGDAKNDPPVEAVSFVAQIIVINHPNEIRKGYAPIVDCGTSHVACQFAKILSKVDRRTGKVLEENPEFIKNGDSAMVEFIPSKPMIVETYAEFPSLGRFACRDMKTTVAVGVIKSVTKKVIETKKGGGAAAKKG